MTLTTSNRPRSKWQAPVIVTAVALVNVFLYELANKDFGDGLFVVPVAILVLLVFLIFGRRNAMLARIGLPVIFLFCSWQMFQHSEVIRTDVRWFIASRSWKARVLEEAPRPGSEMKCVEWDGWGMSGNETNMFLVYSPDDALRNYSPTNLNGLPIPVWRVRRLEKQWYSVTFYTSEGWDGCEFVS